MNALLVTIMMVLVWVPHGDLHTRIASLDAEVEAKPSSVELRLRRGEILRLHGEHFRALKDYKLAQKLDPKNGAVHLLRGRLYIDMQKYDAAASEIHRYLASNKKSPEAYRFLAMNELGRKKNAKAVEYYRTLFTLPVNHRPDDILCCARTIEMIADQGPKVALKFLAERLVNQPAMALELESLRLEVALKDVGPPIARLKRLAKGSKRQDIWSVRAAEVYDNLGHPKLALTSWLKAKREFAALSRVVKNRPANVALTKKIETEVLRHLGRENDGQE